MYFGTGGVFFFDKTIKALGVEYTNIFSSICHKGPTVKKGVVSNYELWRPQNSTLDK